MPLSLLCVGHPLLGMWSILKCSYCNQWDSTGKNQIFLCQQVLITDNFLVRGGNLFLLSSLSSGTPSGLTLCSTCASPVHSVTVFELVCVCVSVPLCQQDICFHGISRPLWLLQSFGLFCKSSWSLGGGDMKTSHLGLSAPKSLTLYIYTI